MKNSTTVKHLVLPEVTEIPQQAFIDCTTITLESISAHEVTTIGQQAFQNCRALKSVNFPKAETIVMYAFYGCSSLTTVNLPAATTIGNYAFYGCDALTNLTFGSVIESVGTNAFGNANTAGCTLTLASGQKQSETLAPSGNTWAGYTWKEIIIK